MTMKHAISTCLLLLLTIEVFGATENHAVVPATRGNKLSLEVVNNSGGSLEGFTAVVSSKPAWITMSDQVPVTQVLMPDATTEITLMFDTAPGLKAGSIDSVKVQIVSGGQIVAYHTVYLIVAVPQVYSLDQNYPNPFNPTTTIQYQIPVDGLVTMKVYDILGREVATLVNAEQKADYYKTSFDGNNLASGVYFYRIQAGNFSDTKRFMLLK